METRLAAEALLRVTYLVKKFVKRRKILEKFVRRRKIRRRDENQIAGVGVSLWQIGYLA